MQGSCGRDVQIPRGGMVVKKLRSMAITYGTKGAIHFWLLPYHHPQNKIL